jgi:hypothetical protein
MGTIRHGDVLFAIDGTRVYRAELKVVCVWECVRVSCIRPLQDGH